MSLRLRREEKRAIARAAAIEGRTVTDYVVDTLTRAATVAVRRATTRELSVRDTKRFLALLAKPPAPSQALRAAARRAAKLAKSL